MAVIIDDAQLTTLAKAILTATSPWMTPGSDPYEASWPKTKEYLRQIMVYLTDKVTVDTALESGVRTIETYVAGVGDNGGALNAAPYPVVGSVNDGFKETAKGTIS